VTGPPSPGHLDNAAPLAAEPVPPMFSQHLAGFGQRVLAAMIDLAVIMTLAFGSVVAGSLAAGNVASTARLPLGSAIAIGLGIAAGFGGPNVYLLLCWCRGQTIGMHALGIQVVSVAGGPITTGQAMLRVAGAYWSILLAGTGFLVIAVDARRRGLHDRMAGSRVIEARPRAAVGAARLTAGTAPPGMPNPDPVRRGWRSLDTWGRSPWTWTDVIPVVAIFVPMLTWTAGLLDWLRGAVQPTPPTGFARGIELVVLDALGYSGCLLLLFLTVRVRRGAGLRDLGLGRPPLRWLAVSVPALLFAMVLESSTTPAGNSLFPGTPNTQCTELRDAYAGYLPVAILVVSVFAPVVEETFFRGFLLRHLRDRLPWWAALVISSALFSAAHYSYSEPTIFLPIFCTGLVLGGLYLWSGSVWPGVITHGLFNLIPLLVLFVGNRGC